MNFNALYVFTIISLVFVISSTDARPSRSGDGDLEIHHFKNFLGTPINYTLDKSTPGYCTQINDDDRNKVESFKSAINCVKLCEDAKCTDCKKFEGPVEVKDLTRNHTQLKGNFVAFKPCNEKKVEENIPTDEKKDLDDSKRELPQILKKFFAYKYPHLVFSLLGML